MQRQMQDNFFQDLQHTAPYYIARSVTSTGRKHTNGHATETFFSPSATLDGRHCRPDVWDIPLGELAVMIGDHLAWNDRIQDEMLSWTDSWLFAIVHLYLPHLKGQTDAYLFCLDDRRRAHKLHDQAGAQERAEFFFFPALPLSNAVKLLDYPWSTFMQGNLVYRRFTHEYLTHGVVQYPKDDRLQPIQWENLQKDIFSLLPEMRVPEGKKAFGLTQVLLHLRRVNYDGPARLTTESELNAAEKLARLHVRVFPAEYGLTLPPLAIFINYLTLRKRGSNGPLFQERVRQLGYTRLDLDDLLYEDYEILPDNLPERASLLDLMRNVQAIVGGPPLRRNIIITEDTVSGHKFLEAENLSRASARLKFDPSKEKKVNRNGKENPDYADRRFCLYDCHCTIWEATRSVDKEPLKGDDKSNSSDELKEKVEFDEDDWTSL